MKEATVVKYKGAVYTVHLNVGSNTDEDQTQFICSMCSSICDTKTMSRTLFVEKVCNSDGKKVLNMQEREIVKREAIEKLDTPFDIVSNDNGLLCNMCSISMANIR